MRAARELLARLGAIDAAGHVTDTGRAMLRFAVHPRAARVVVEGERRGVADDACVAAALLAEGDIRARAARASADARGQRHGDRGVRPRALLDLFREAEDSRFSRRRPPRGGARRRGDARRGEGREAARARHAQGARAGRQDGERLARRGAPRWRSSRLPGPRGASACAAEGDSSRSREEGRRSSARRASSATPSGWWRSTPRSATQGARGRRWSWFGSRARSSPSGSSTSSPRRSRSGARSRWNAQAERVEAREEMVVGRPGAARRRGRGASGARRPPGSSPRRRWPRGRARSRRRDALDRWLCRARFAASVDASMSAPDDEAVRRTLVSLSQGLRSFAELRHAGLLDALKASTGRPGDVDRLAPERVTLAGAVGDDRVRARASRPGSRRACRTSSG